MIGLRPREALTTILDIILRSGEGALNGDRKKTNGKSKGWTWRLSRDSILFGVGIAGIVYETLITGADRIQLLLLFAGMVGLPAFIRTDESRQSPPPPPPPEGPTK